MYHHPIPLGYSHRNHEPQLEKMVRPIPVKSIASPPIRQVQRYSLCLAFYQQAVLHKIKNRCHLRVQLTSQEQEMMPPYHHCPHGNGRSTSITQPTSMASTALSPPRVVTSSTWAQSLQLKSFPNPSNRANAFGTSESHHPMPSTMKV